MTVGDFLRAQPLDRPWNCSTEPSDWCVSLGHPDFAAPWRDIVDDLDCEAVAAGNLAGLWHEGIGNALPSIEASYQPGDIGVVEVHGFQSGAIFTGDKWAIRTRRGHLFASPEQVSVRQAWRP